MTQPRTTRTRIFNALAIAGGIPLAAGGGVFLTGGLSGVFSMAAAGAAAGGWGLCFITIGALLAGASAGILSYKAMNGGFFGKLDIISGALSVLVGIPLLVSAGLVLGAAGGGALAKTALSAAQEQKQALPVRSQNPY